MTSGWLDRRRAYPGWSCGSGGPCGVSGDSWYDDGPCFQLNMAAGSVYAGQSGRDEINYAPDLRVAAAALVGFRAPVMAFVTAVGVARFGDRLTHGVDPVSPGFGATPLPMGDHDHGRYLLDPVSRTALAEWIVGVAP